MEFQKNIVLFFCLYFILFLSTRICYKMEEINYLNSLIERGQRSEIRRIFDQKQSHVFNAIPDTFSTNRLETDTISQLLIPEPFQNLKAVKTKGDGNCLYHAASIGLSGKCCQIFLAFV